MAKFLVDSFYCPEIGANTGGTVMVYVDTTTNVVSTSSTAYAIPNECYANRSYAEGAVMYTYCNTETGEQYEVYATVLTPFGAVRKTGVVCYMCAATITVASITHESVSGKKDGSATIAFDNTLQNRSWQLNNSVYTFSGVEGVFSGLAAGTYTAKMVYGPEAQCWTSVNFTIKAGTAAPTLSLAKKDATKNGVCDGTITATVSGGASPYTYLWNDGATTKDRTGLCAGTYTLTVTDSGGAKASASITISQPTAEVPKGPGIFYVSPALGLRFLPDYTPVDCDPITLLHNFHIEYERPGGHKACYYQKFSQCDNLPLQALSNYTTNKIEVVSIATGGVVSSSTMKKVASFSNLSETFSGYIKAHSASQTRVYFNTAFLPVPLVAGNSVQIQNTTVGDGIYSIQSIQKETNGSQYLVINLAYAEPSPTTAISVITYYNKKEYDVWEGAVNFALLPEGRYWVYMRGSDGNGTTTYRSEPIFLKEKHPGTVGMSYRHSKAAHDIYYANGFTNFTRFEGTLIEGANTTEITQHREPHRLVILDSKVFIRYNLRTYALPNYLHNILTFACSYDTVFADSIQVICEGGYNMEDLLGRSTLANGVALLEAQNYANFMRGDTLTVESEEGGLIEISEGNFLKYK